MIDEKAISQLNAPSKGKIALATVVALIVGAIVLVVAVLPAEYGIDPLGTGKALGLLALSDAAAATPDEAAKPAQPAGLKKGEIRTAPALAGWNKNHDGLYKVDNRQIELGPHQGMEFKYRIAKGDGMIYAWQAPVKMRYEFHGEPEGGVRGTYESYAIDEGEGVERGNGTFIAPFTGIHGWYWENTTDQAVTIQLTTAGFYTGGKEFRKGFQGDHEMPDVKMGK